MKNKKWVYTKYSASLRENQSSSIDKTKSRPKRNDILKNDIKMTKVESNTSSH
jgi:hypothetical protein